jgi:hypothetical protein
MRTESAKPSAGTEATSDRRSVVVPTLLGCIALSYGACGLLVYNAIVFLF